MLAYLDGNHYDIVWSMEHKEANIFCQSRWIGGVGEVAFFKSCCSVGVSVCSICVYV